MTPKSHSSPLAGERAKRRALSRGGAAAIGKNARSLRKNPTDAEKRLWWHLRSKQLAGYKFRRQQPIDHYIVDFVSFDHRLIIELDGGQHADQQKNDTVRTLYLEKFGFRILRFWNNEVLKNTEGVLETILTSLCPPTLTLPRKGGGKR